MSYQNFGLELWSVYGEASQRQEDRSFLIGRRLSSRLWTTFCLELVNGDEKEMESLRNEKDLGGTPESI